MAAIKSSNIVDSTHVIQFGRSYHRSKIGFKLFLSDISEFESPFDQSGAEIKTIASTNRWQPVLGFFRLSLLISAPSSKKKGILGKNNVESTMLSSLAAAYFWASYQ